MAAGVAAPAPVAGGVQAKQQFYENSCGAACLLCAGLETGNTAFPAIGGPAGAPATNLLNDNASETSLYYITSGLAAANQPFGNVAGAGYSMPSRVVEAALHIGFQNVRIFMRGTLSGAILSAAYAAEVQRCIALAAAPAGNVAMTRGRAARFGNRAAQGANEYKLVVVMPYMLSLHYVLHRPNGSYMDPATGQNLTSMPTLYNRTGISIYIS